MLHTLADNSIKDWPQKHSKTIPHTLAGTTSYTAHMSKWVMVCYFTDRPPYLQDFHEWAEYEMHSKNGWWITHMQYMGKNFFLIEFDEADDRDEALDLAPWFFGRKFLYTFPWEPNFDVTTGNYHMLPLWVEFPFRSVALEGAKYKLANSLGEVLLYVRGNKQSSYPNDKACILGDLREQIPMSIRVHLSKTILIWQPIIFKHVPFSCYHYNEPDHFARSCPLRFPPTDQNQDPKNHLGPKEEHYQAKPEPDLENPQGASNDAISAGQTQLQPETNPPTTCSADANQSRLRENTSLQ